MANETLNLRHVGPIAGANISFEILRSSLGPSHGEEHFPAIPEASGRLWPIFRTLRLNGVDWDHKTNAFLAYLEKECQVYGTYSQSYSLARCAGGPGAPGPFASQKKSEEAFFYPRTESVGVEP